MAKKKHAKKVVKTTAPKKKEVVRDHTPLAKAKALFNRENYQKDLARLSELRKYGSWMMLKIKDENINVKINKQLTREAKRKILSMNRGEMQEAKKVERQNREEVNEIVARNKETIAAEFAPVFLEAKMVEKDAITKAKYEYQDAVAKAKAEYREDLAKLKEKYKDKNDNKKAKKIDYNACRISFKSKLNAAKNNRFAAIEEAKEERYQTYQQKHEYLNALCLNKVGEVETNKYAVETYIRNFNFVNWLTKNALLIIVFVIFLTMLIMMGTGFNNSQLTATFFLKSLVEISPKIFFALGVAGLILLGGTDLSIGRLTAVGASFTLMILSSNPDQMTIFPGLYAQPLALRVFIAILVSIFLCTIFTSISGFFTAKFKMHPFISTLAMQLIVYGLFLTFFGSVSSFTITTEIQNTLALDRGWLLIIFATIAIVVVWFIWNKTKFGKNLYAVGGNPEAATVSGINPFVITMLAFVMAGILYGLGGYVQALQEGSANFNSYNGSETDAIAACVIGGISFSGGVGSVLGAVGGCVILGFLTSCFNELGIATSLQFVIKGLIILIAVTLDCVKYIRKK